jgi:hypothetical protein
MRLPKLTVGLAPAPTPAAVPVTVRLKENESDERPCLWVIDGQGLDRLHAFVSHAGQALIEVLEFAVSNDGRVALRTTGGRSGPPTLFLPALAYVPLLMLPGVYRPAGTRLRPPVRRDALRDWLVRPGRVTWLRPMGTGRFEIQSVAADAFRPLGAWVEYHRPPDRCRPVWVANTSFFSMAPFTEVVAASSPNRKERRTKSAQDVEVPISSAVPPKVVKGTAPPKETEVPAPEEPVAIELVPPSELLGRLRDAERRFLAVEGPLDAAERVRLWPGLGNLSAAVGEDEDAGLCWANALWHGDAPAFARRWWQLESRRLPDVDAALRAAEPRPAELRALVAWAGDAASRQPVSGDVASRLAALTRILEEHDHRLPIRLAWLGWVAVSRLSGGDVLALTRARDRLLADLLESGLRKERDLPTFLRAGDARDPTAVRVDTTRILRLRDEAWQWYAADKADAIQRVYLDLVFAYALARFGDSDAARTLLNDIGRPDDAATGRRKNRPAGKTLTAHQRWVWEAYRERVLRHINGDSATAPLSAELRRGLAELDGRVVGEERRTAERFLRVSRILDPFSRVDPFRQNRPRDPLSDELADLAAYTAPRRKRDRSADEIEGRFQSLFKDRPTDALRILQVAVPTSVRVGESFALECVGKVGPELKRAGRWRDARDLIDRVELVEVAIGVAAHFGKQALASGLLAALNGLLKDTKGEIAGWLAAALGSGSIRFLCRLGLPDAARHLLDQLADAVTGGKPVPKFVRTPGLNHGVMYPALLRLAAGWFYFGQLEPARQALAAVRAELFDGSMSPDPRADLAAAYATALGHAPAGEAMAGFTELFARLRVTSYHAIFHRIKIVEAVALATAAEDFADDTRTRRWLDEDEYLVRRRIHADVERALGGAGLR